MCLLYFIEITQDYHDKLIENYTYRNSMKIRNIYNLSLLRTLIISTKHYKTSTKGNFPQNSNAFSSNNIAQQILVNNLAPL